MLRNRPDPEIRRKNHTGGKKFIELTRFLATSMCPLLIWTVGVGVFSMAAMTSRLWRHHVFFHEMMGVIRLLGLAETFYAQVLLPVYIGNV